MGTVFCRSGHPAGARVERIRHEALAAGLVDGWPRGIHDRYGESLEARRDRGSESRRPAADDQDIRLLSVPPNYHLNKTSSAEKPGPIAASRP